MSQQKKSYKRICPAKARDLLSRYPYVLLIDVRYPEEFALGHIPGSTNIPEQYLPWAISSMPVNPYTPIILYCKTGIRAASAASLLSNMGFMEVYTLGGIQDWPYEIVRPFTW